VNAYDVIVCGGGTAGCAAALAARRAGKSVLLVERMSQFGGMGTSGLVCHWLGGRTMDTRHWVVGGIFRELAEKAVAAGIAVLPSLDDFEDVPYTPYGQFKGPLLAGVPFDPFAMTGLIERELLDAGVDCLLQAHVSAVVMDGNRIAAVDVQTKSGPLRIEGTSFIDATGDADVATRAGAGYIQGDELDGDIAGVTLMIQLEGVDEERFMETVIREDDPRQRKRLADLKTRGILDVPMDILVFVKLNREGRFMVNGNWSPAADATDPVWRTKAIMRLRRQGLRLVEAFQEYFPGLENCSLRAIASDLGVRETRRIDGIRRVTIAEVQAGLAEDDAIGLSCYGWDLGGSRNEGQPMHGKPKPPIVPIPYGIMVPKGPENVICPGRAVSVERQVLGPMRVMAPVMAMGEAAGIAACQVVDCRCIFADINVDSLQDQLRQNGALVPAGGSKALIPGASWIDS
jgi:hypothetical protein